MQVTRLTNVFQLTTAPADLVAASPHTGGWTESFWTSLNPNAYNPPWQLWQLARSNLLPTQASIVGYRSQIFTISGNKLLAGGAVSGKQNYPGRSGALCDLPQVALEVNVQGSGVPNTARPVLRGMPDAIMVGGEYQPTTNFKSAFTILANRWAGLNFGFIGRDLAQASVRVLQIVGNAIQLDMVPATGLAVGNFVRLNRVYDDNNNPVKGVFRVLTIAGASITVQGLAAQVTVPSGTLRRDLIDYFLAGSVTPTRAVIKKVGRPSAGYRGRRSKVRA